MKNLIFLYIVEYEILLDSFFDKFFINYTCFSETMIYMTRTSSYLSKAFNKNSNPTESIPPDIDTTILLLFFRFYGSNLPF